MSDTIKSKTKLVPDEKPQKRRIGGQNLIGIIYMADDWDAPMMPEEIAEFEEGEVFPATEAAMDRSL